MKRLPKKHVFPGGFTVYIDSVERGETVRGITLPEDCDGYFDTIDICSGQVLLWQGLTLRQKWRTLAHEIIHGALDAQICIEQEVAP